MDDIIGKQFVKEITPVLDKMGLKVVGISEALDNMIVTIEKLGTKK